MADMLRGAAQIIIEQGTCLVYGVLAYGTVPYIQLDSSSSPATVSRGDLTIRVIKISLKCLYDIWSIDPLLSRNNPPSLNSSMTQSLDESSPRW